MSDPRQFPTDATVFSLIVVGAALVSALVAFVLRALA